MLHEFDMWLHTQHLNDKARKDRWAWNFGIKMQRPIAVRENRQWKPAVAYCRYADDFVVIVKGTKAQAEALREDCRVILEDKLKLKLNMAKTHITHVNDGFVFLGHRIIRKCNSTGGRTVFTTIPNEKAKGFAHKLTTELSGDYDLSAVDMIERLNQQLTGWGAFYKFTDHKARTFQNIDTIVFWKLGYWLARKYRCRIKLLMRKWYRAANNNSSKTWIVNAVNERGNRVSKALRRLVGNQKAAFRWRNPEDNPYIKRIETRNTITSRYHDVAMAMSRA